MCQSVRRCRRRTTFRRCGSAGGGGAGGDEGGVLVPAGQQRCYTRRRSPFSVWPRCYAPSWPPWTPQRRRNLTSPGPREATRRPSLSSRRLTQSNSSGSSTRRTLLPCTGVSVSPSGSPNFPISSGGWTTLDLARLLGRAVPRIKMVMMMAALLAPRF